MRSNLLAIFLAAGLVSAYAPAIAADQQTGQTITRKSELATNKGSSDFFTGDVSVTQLYPAKGAMKSSGGVVTFQPGARSNWHVHPVGQVLIVTEGTGRAGEWGKPFQEIRAGDVVVCPAGVKHWHGAAPDSAMTHISICEEKEPGKVVEWLEKVTDDQYNAK